MKKLLEWRLWFLASVDFIFWKYFSRADLKYLLTYSRVSITRITRGRKSFEPSWHTTLFRRPYNFIWTLCTLDGRYFEVVCRLGVFEVFYKSLLENFHGASKSVRKWFVIEVWVMETQARIWKVASFAAATVDK